MGVIHRDPAACQAQRFDLIVVGGGVYGVAIALESSRRGLRPLLLERGDFGAATSANTLRILHGGMRYLQGLDLTRFRASVAQRRWWSRVFPELVRPLPCLMPLYGRGLQRREIFRLALLMSDALSLDRNRGVPDGMRIGRGRVLGAQETLERFPAVNRDGLNGGALWYDGDMVSPHRLLIEMLRWTCALGGVALNHVEASALITHAGRVQGVQATDRLGRTDLQFRAPIVVNAAGPWSRDLARDWARDVPDLFRASLAYNVLLDRSLPAIGAVAVRSNLPDSQVFFLRAHGRYTLAGTVHEPWPVGKEPPTNLSEESLNRFLAHLCSAVPAFGATMDDVIRELPGLVPALAVGSEKTSRRPVLVDHRDHRGPDGLISVSGVKFTTAPAVARRAVSLIVGKKGPDRLTGIGSRPDVRSWVSPAEFQTLLRTSPADAERLIHGLVSEEATTSFEDLVVRRLDWALEVKDLEEARRLLEPVLGGLPVRFASRPVR